MTSTESAITGSGYAVFGGTFDPVHFGHLRSAMEVRQALGVSTLKLVPACIPPHRNLPLTSVQHRLAMLYLATRDQEYLCVDEREIRRQGKSFTVDTLASIRAEIGTQCPLFLVLGADAYALIDDWFAWERLTDLAHIVVLERPGFHPQATSDRVKKWSKDKYVSDPRRLANVSAGAICRLKLTQIDISATKIRELIRRGYTIDYLLPQEVIQYISEHNLYGKDLV